jgi:hypothetical protein
MNRNLGVRLAILALMLAVGFTTAGVAQDPPASSSVKTDLGFLEVGKSYLIRFPEDRHPVQMKESGIEPQPSGAPLTWRANFQIDVFVVRKLGGGSWALLEHPIDPKAALDVLSARSLIADKVAVAKIEADPSRKDFLAKRREAARAELKTTSTWVNLAHAISISDPPAERRWEQPKLSVEVR